MLIAPEALRAVVEFLTAHRVPYMVIGGLAISIWGEVRVTKDADFKVAIRPERTLADFRRQVVAEFPERVSAVPARKRSTYVIQVWAKPGVPVDILISIFDYERQAIERAVDVAIEGVPVRVCRPEDLIVHKAVANRAQDWIDIERVLLRQRGKLDQGYIMSWLEQFAEGLEAPEIVARYSALREQFDPT